MTLWYTFIMAIIVALVLVFMLVVGGNMVLNSSEKQLIHVVQENSDEIDYSRGVLELDEFDFYDTGVYTLIYDEDKQLIAGAGYLPFEGEDLFENAVTRTVNIDGTDHLIYDLHVKNPNGNIWLRGIRSTEENSTVVRTIVILSLVLFPVLVVIAALGGWLIANRSLKPITQIINTVNTITNGNDLKARIGLKPGRDEVHRLGATFDGLLDRLSYSFEQEKQFASDASHELRTPTAIILAECEFAEKNAQSVEDYKEALEVIERQGKKMSELVDKLLTITRMEQGSRKISFENADLSELTEIVCDEMSLTDGRDIELTKDIEPDIFAEIDVGLITRLVQNLLGNAYKFTDEGGHIKVSLHRHSHSIVLSVKDSGCGIEEKDLPKIWTRLWQADSSRGEGSGSGLGLSMVKQIAELHGGRMSVRSKLGEGSTFTFTLPMQKSPSGTDE